MRFLLAMILIFSAAPAWPKSNAGQLGSFFQQLQQELASQPDSIRIVALGPLIDQLARDKRVTVPIMPSVYLDEIAKTGFINSNEKQELAKLIQSFIHSRLDFNSLTLADFHMGQPPHGIRRAQMGIYGWLNVGITVVIVAWIASNTFKYYQAMLKERAQLDKQTQDDILRSHCAELALNPDVSKDLFEAICSAENFEN